MERCRTDPFTTALQPAAATKDPPNMPMFGQRVRCAGPPATEGVVVGFDGSNGIDVHWDTGLLSSLPASMWMSTILPVQAGSTASSPSPITPVAPLQEQRLCARPGCEINAESGAAYCSLMCAFKHDRSL